ncbi:MAG: hypothetical protein HYW50_04110 [Candidatus Diapherotrites archaeon]|nr:hypothetical protein [Candidatus Diapherotrites archaeon]
MKKMIQAKDMPKLLSPFKRKIDEQGFYIVYNEVEDGMNWVFEDESVLAEEKLDGTNVSIIIEGGKITRLFNRTEQIPFFGKGKSFIVKGVLESFERGYCDLPEGQHFGELIGEKVNGNPYRLEGHLWIPFFTYAKNHLAYKSWGKYPKTFQAISDWLEKDIFSLFMRRKGIVEKPEGIVFVHPDGRMAKLRRDMFSWFSGDSHHKRKSKEKE